MPYVKRDDLGNIVGILSHPNDEANELVEDAVLYKSPADIFDDARRQEYEKEGVTIDKMIVALWENDQVAINALEAKRQAVKLRVPK